MNYFYYLPPPAVFVVFGLLKEKVVSNSNVLKLCNILFLCNLWAYELFLILTTSPTSVFYTGAGFPFSFGVSVLKEAQAKRTRWFTTGHPLCEINGLKAVRVKSVCTQKRSCTFTSDVKPPRCKQKRSCMFTKNWKLPVRKQKQYYMFTVLRKTSECHWVGRCILPPGWPLQCATESVAAPQRTGNTSRLLTQPGPSLRGREVSLFFPDFDTFIFSIS